MSNGNYFMTIKQTAPTLLRGHPVSYVTVPQSSILDPYGNNFFHFPEKQMEYSIYKHLGNGLYATDHTAGSFDKDGNFKAKQFSIGVKSYGKNATKIFS